MLQGKTDPEEKRKTIGAGFIEVFRDFAITLKSKHGSKPKFLVQVLFHPSFHLISFHFISFHLISFHFISFHFIPYSLGCGASCGLITHPGLKAQMYVVCDKSKLVGVLFRKEPQVPLLVV